ncbi:MAG: hypothetical protein ACK59Y_09320, partial [Betaproteobacteria bacterium]
MHQQLIKLTAALLVFAAVATAHAAELRIGVVDQERITRESAPAERASKQLEKEFAPRSRALGLGGGGVTLELVGVAAAQLARVGG